MFLPHLCDMNPEITYCSDDIIIIDNFYKEYESQSKIEKINKMNLTQITDFKWKCNIRDKKLSDLLTVIIGDKVQIEDWTFKEINENWRCVKSIPGYKMSNHLDQQIIKDISTKSFFSILIYLTNNPEGCLVFKDLIVQPKAGRVVVFNQNLLHKAEESLEDKYFLHSEIFFYKRDEITESDKKDFQTYLDAISLKDEKEKEKILQNIFQKNKKIEELIFS